MRNLLENANLELFIMKSNKINFKTKLKHSKSHNPPELEKNRVVSVQNYLKQKKR